MNENNANNADNTVSECIICGEEHSENDKYIKTICSHLFHEKCLSKWLNINNSCPYCRKYNPFKIIANKKSFCISSIDQVINRDIIFGPNVTVFRNGDLIDRIVINVRFPPLTDADTHGTDHTGLQQ